MKYTLLLTLPLLLAACAEEAQAPAEAETVNEDAEAPAEVANVDLTGDYTMTSFNGVTLGKNVNTAFGTDTLTVSTDCATMVWNYALQGNVISLTPASGQSGGCAGSGNTAENGIVNAMEQVTIAMEMNGGLTLSGAGGNIELMPR